MHFIFYVDGEQAKRIGSKTCITYNGTKYNMDVKFRDGLWNCQPSKIDGYRAFILKPIQTVGHAPQLPDELFNAVWTQEPEARVELVQPSDKTLFLQLCECI